MNRYNGNSRSSSGFISNSGESNNGRRGKNNQNYNNTNYNNQQETDNNNGNDNNSNSAIASSTKDANLIKQTVQNIEHTTEKMNIYHYIKTALKLNGEEEIHLRLNTITFKVDNKEQHDTIELALTELQQLVIELDGNDNIIKNIFHDKNNVYCTAHDKQVLMRHILKTNTNNNDDPTDNSNQQILNRYKKLSILRNNLLPPVNGGKHFMRKEITLKLNFVKHYLKLKDIEQYIIRVFNVADCKAHSFTETKPNKNNQVKTIYFKVNTSAFEHLHTNLNGIIRYRDINKDNNEDDNNHNAAMRRITKQVFVPKISCRPTQCGKCLDYKLHLNNNNNCSQKCGNCSISGHRGDQCRSKTSYCCNCRQAGHGPRSKSCQRYITEALKKVKELDIPTEYYTDDLKLTKLIQALDYKN